MVISMGALTAPAGKVMVNPVFGMEITPPDLSIVCLTVTTSCRSQSLFHHSALSSMLELGRAPVLADSVAAAAALGSRGDVGLRSPESEQDAMREAARRRLKERKSLFITIRPEIGVTRATGPPKATAMPSPN